MASQSDAPSHDIFLSHNSCDKPFVRELAERLKAEGIRPWIDEWDLNAGDQIQRHLSNVLDTIPVVGIVIGPGGIGPWHNAEIEVVVHRRVYDTNKTLRIIPILMAGVARSDRKSIPAFLRDSLWVEFRDDRPYDKSFRDLVRGIRGWRDRTNDEPVTKECPYRGLAFFDVDHAPFFHGRGPLTQWLLEKLRKQPGSAEPNRMLGILGASGSGKSSLARAGILAQIKAGELPDSDTWPRVIVRIGSNPLEALATSLVRVRCEDQKSEASPTAVFEMIQSMKDFSQALSVFVDLWLGEQRSERRVVLLIDQFEELFSMAPEFTKDQAEKSATDAKLRRAFVQNIYHAATVAQGRMIVIITMRADFYHKCAVYDELPRLFTDSSPELVGPLNEIELRDVIDRPAWQTGCQVESGLVDMLVHEVRGQRGNLPLLQFALTELWEHREENRLTAAAYRQFDGLTGVLNRRAEKLFENFSLEQQQLCENLFLRLTQPGAGTEDTKRRVTRKELDLDSNSPSKSIRDLLKQLSQQDTRLIVSDDTGVEIAHEALIRGWDRLKKWINEHRRGIEIHRRLTDAAVAWQKARRENPPPQTILGLLYRTPHLEEAVELRDNHPDWLNSLESSFVEESAKEQKRIADTERLAKRRLVLISRGLAAVLVLAIASGIWGWKSSFEAKRATVSEREARKAALVELARNDLVNARFAIKEFRLDDALIWFERAIEHAPADHSLYSAARSLLASRSMCLHFSFVHDRFAGVAFSPDAQTVVNISGNTARLWNAQTGAPRGEPLQHDGEVNSVEFSPDAHTVVTRSGKSARLWNAQSGAPRGEPLQHDGRVTAVAFSPDGQTVLTGSDDTTARLWNALTGAPCGEPLQHDDRVTAVAFSRDGQTVLTGSFYGKARLWNAQTGAPRGEPLMHDGGVDSVAFSPDGQTVLTRGHRTAQLWNTQTGAPRGEPLKHDEDKRVNSVAFSPDGQTVLTGSDDTTARLWNALTGAPRGKPLQHDGWVTAIAFSPDGQTVVTGSHDKTARLWNALTGTPCGEPLKHDYPVIAVAFSPDGQTVRTRSWDKTRIWDAQTGALRGQSLQHNYPVIAVAFSPDGQTILTGSTDKKARFWNAQTGAPRGEPLKHDDAVSAVAFSPDGQTVLTGSWDKKARFWDAQTGAPRGEPLQHDGSVYSVAFSPDGQTVLTGSWDKTARLWNAQTGVPRGEPLQHDGNVNSVAFSPDGQTVLTGSSDVVVYSTNGQIESIESTDNRARLWNALTGTLRGERLEHNEGVSAVAFSPDGQTVLTGCWDRTAKIWSLAPPSGAKTIMDSRLRLSVEVRTGKKFDENQGIPVQLSFADWNERRMKLEELGGPIDVRTWDQVSDKEKSQLRKPVRLFDD